MNEFIFYLIALCICVFGFLSVCSRSIFHCAMYLAMCLLSIAGLYFYLDAQFLGIIQTLVYVGGIVTLFVYAIKLTAHIGDPQIKQVNAQLWPAALITSGILVMVLRAFFGTSLVSMTRSQEVTGIAVLGKGFMTTFALPFEFMSVVLLAALVGAIVIGRGK